MMKFYSLENLEFFWDKQKNEKLIIERKISFEDVLVYLSGNSFLKVVNGNRNNQSYLLLEIEGYIYVVPFTKDGNKIFFKTIFPSRKMTKKYLGGNHEKS